MHKSNGKERTKNERKNIEFGTKPIHMVEKVFLAHNIKNHSHTRSAFRNKPTDRIHYEISDFSINDLNVVASKSPLQLSNLIFR